MKHLLRGMLVLVLCLPIPALAQGEEEPPDPAPPPPGGGINDPQYLGGGGSGSFRSIFFLPRAVAHYGASASFNSRTVASVPVVGLSFLRPAFDAEIRPIVTSPNGYGASFSLDLGSLVADDALPSVVRKMRRLQGEKRKQGSAFMPTEATISNLEETYNDIWTDPRISLIGDYTHFQKTGTYESLGLGLNYVWDRGLGQDDRTWGLLLQAAGSVTRFDDARGESSTLRGTVRLLWMDQIPTLRAGTIHRNRCRAGVEWTPSNNLANRDQYAFVVQLFVGPKTFSAQDEASVRQLIRDQVNVSLRAGSGPDGKFLGFVRVSKSAAF